MLAELTREELAAGLDRVAEEVLREAGVSAPRWTRLPSPRPSGLPCAG